MTDHAGTVIGGSHERRTPNEPRSVSARMVGSSGSQRSKTNWGAAQSRPITRTRLAIAPALVARQPQLFRCETGELPRGQTDAAPLADCVEQLEIEPVPTARAGPVEALRMPQDREAAPMLSRPVEE